MSVFSWLQAAMLFAVTPSDRFGKAAGMTVGVPEFSGHFIDCVFPSDVVGSLTRRDCMQSYVTGESIRSLSEKRWLPRHYLAQRLNVGDKTVSK